MIPVDIEMIVPLLTLSVGLTAGQCMRMSPCGTLKGLGRLHARLSLSQCIDHCFANTKGQFCVYMQWLPSTSHCFESFITSGHQPLGNQQCVRLSKTSCSGVPDFLCMMRYSQSSDEYGEMSGSTSQYIGGNVHEHDCLAVCRLDPYCRGVVWNRERQSCRWFYHTYGNSPMHESANRLEDQQSVFYKKRNNCAAVQRPASFLALSKMSSTEPLKSNRTLDMCLNKWISSPKVFELQWHPTRGCLAYTVKKRTILQKRETPLVGRMDVTVNKINCSMTTGCPNRTEYVVIDRCIRMERTAGRGMSGGLLLTLSSKGCEDLCKSCSNCQAVDWRQITNQGEGQCFFHHLRKPLLQMPYRVHITMKSSCKTLDKADRAMAGTGKMEDDVTSKDCHLLFYGINRCRLKCLARKGCLAYLYSPSTLHCCLVFGEFTEAWTKGMIRFNLSPISSF